MDKLLDDIILDVKYNDQNYALCANYYRDISNLSVSYDDDAKGYQMQGVIKFTFVNTSNFNDRSRPEGFVWINQLNESLCEFFNIKHTILVAKHSKFLNNIELENHQIVCDMVPTFCKMILKGNP